MSSYITHSNQHQYTKGQTSRSKERSQESQDYVVTEGFRKDNKIAENVQIIYKSQKNGLKGSEWEEMNRSKADQSQSGFSMRRRISDISILILSFVGPSLRRWRTLAKIRVCGQTAVVRHYIAIRVLSVVSNVSFLRAIRIRVVRRTVMRNDRVRVLRLSWGLHYARWRR